MSGFLGGFDSWTGLLGETGLWGEGLGDLCLSCGGQNVKITECKDYQMVRLRISLPGHQQSQCICPGQPQKRVPLPGQES